MKAASLVSLALALAFVYGCSDVSGGPADAGPSCTAASGNGDDESDADTDGGESVCKPGDADGVNGGCFAFTITVDDNGFSPIILKAENNARVVVTVKNAGTKAHDFSVGCIATSNLRGCPAQTCFPAASAIPAISPGASASVSFVTPNPEGIYVFRSDLNGDSHGDSQIESDGGLSGIWGQFVIQ